MRSVIRPAVAHELVDVNAGEYRHLYFELRAEDPPWIYSHALARLQELAGVRRVRQSIHEGYHGVASEKPLSAGYGALLREYWLSC